MPSPEAEESTYAMNVVVSGVPFWEATRTAFDTEMSSDTAADGTFGGPLDTDASKQIEEVEALLASGIDGLIIAPTDSEALTPVIDKAVDAGVIVVTYLIDAPSSKRHIYVTSELEESSYRLGLKLFAEDHQKGKAVISIAEAGNEEQEPRANRFKRAIAETEGVELHTVIEDKYDAAVGAEIVKPLLADNEVRYILGCNSRSAAGAVIALKESGKKKGDVLLTGWDRDDDLLAQISEGWVKASVGQRSEYLTALALDIIESHQNGIFNRTGPPLYPREVQVPVFFIDSSNVAEF
jgi:ABC-type sugar transport system substrate-binding protein